MEVATVAIDSNEVNVVADKIDRDKIIAKVRKIHSKEVGVGQANSWVCPECKHETRIDKESMTFKFNPEVIVQDITIDRCENCGFECVSEEEYEKVRKLVHQVKAPFKPHGEYGRCERFIDVERCDKPAEIQLCLEHLELIEKDTLAAVLALLDAKIAEAEKYHDFVADGQLAVLRELKSALEKELKNDG